MKGPTLFVLFLFISIVLPGTAYYKPFQVMKNFTTKVYTVDITDNDLLLVTATEDGVGIFIRDNSGEQFIEGDSKNNSKTVVADVTPSGDYLLSLPSQGSEDISVFWNYVSGNYGQSIEFRETSVNSLGGFLTDDHQWILETKKISGMHVYFFDDSNVNITYTHLEILPGSMLDYAETTSDYAFSVVGSLNKEMHVLKFNNGKFEVFQTIPGTSQRITPSITNDHQYIIFGDEESGEPVARVYSFKESGYELLNSLVLIDNPNYCSLSSTQTYFAVSSDSSTYIYRNILSNFENPDFINLEIGGLHHKFGKD